MSILMDLGSVKERISASQLKIIEETRNGNDKATVLKLANGGIVNCWDTGKVTVQGKAIQEIEKIISNQNNNTMALNKKVFVVYGHDLNARTQLEAMLRRWDLEPIIIDQQLSSGNTIIEKLEAYTKEVGFGIVLATPDDIGYPKGKETEKKFRVRQNVVLELGMLLSLVGRSRVAILLSQSENMERPSDIDGLIYIPFKDNVEEAKLSLAKEMNNNGYTIGVDKL